MVVVDKHLECVPVKLVTGVLMVVGQLVLIRGTFASLVIHQPATAC
jgi:hypothetical protein